MKLAVSIALLAVVAAVAHGTLELPAWSALVLVSCRSPATTAHCDDNAQPTACYSPPISLITAAAPLAIAGSTTRSRSTVFLGQQVDKKRLLKRIAGVQGEDVCVGLKSANSGYRFKTATRGVLFEKCADGRDCHKLIDCKTSKNKLCLEVCLCGWWWGWGWELVPRRGNLCFSAFAAL